jgi:hypothetical protein
VGARVRSQDAAIGTHINITINAHAKVKMARKAEVYNGSAHPFLYLELVGLDKEGWLTNHTL